MTLYGIICTTKRSLDNYSCIGLLLCLYFVFYLHICDRATLKICWVFFYFREPERTSRNSKGITSQKWTKNYVGVDFTRDKKKERKICPPLFFFPFLHFFCSIIPSPSGDTNLWSRKKGWRIESWNRDMWKTRYLREKEK